MTTGQPPEAIDTRLVFRVYACIAALGALSAMVVAVLITRSPQPSLQVAASLGLVGAISLLLAGQAAAFSKVDDPLGRLRGLKHFAVAHLAVAGFLWLLPRMFDNAAAAREGFQAIAAVIPYWLLASNLFITAAVLLYLAYTASPGPRFTATVRSTTLAPDGRPRAFALREKGGSGSMRRLRSQYEEQIRQAARQEERARLARDLHDAVKQQLFVVQTAAATVQARFESDPAAARRAVDDVRTAARGAMSEMEAMLDQLQAAPLENAGLVEALKTQCEALGFRTGAAVTIDVQPLPAAHLLPPGAHRAIFRVAQEALANAGRHARASQVTVRLIVRERALVLEVIDNGTGFDPMARSAGMGIGNMQARASDIGGHFELASSPGAGTTVSLSVPFAARASSTYLLLSAAFAAALAICIVLVVRDAGLQPWAIGAGAIAAIGTVRHAVAFVRVRRQDRSA